MKNILIFFTFLISLISCVTEKASESLEFFENHKKEFNELKEWFLINEMSSSIIGEDEFAEFPKNIQELLKSLKICRISTDPYYKCEDKKSIMFQFDGCKVNSESTYIYFRYYDCPEQKRVNSFNVKDYKLGNGWNMRQMNYDYIYD